MEAALAPMMETVAQVGMTILPAMSAGSAAREEGAFLSQQYEMQARQIEQQAKIDEINQREKTLRAVAAIRAAGAASGVTESGSITSSIEQARRQGMLDIINTKSSAAIDASGRRAQGAQAIVAGRNRSNGLMFDAFSKVQKSGALKSIGY